MANIGEMLKRYNDLIEKTSPGSAIGDAFLATGAPIKYPITDPSTIVNWASSEIDCVEGELNIENMKKMNSLIDEGLNESTFRGMNKEISTMYLTAYDLQNAEIYLEAVASISEKTITKDNESRIKSFINKFYNSVEVSVQRISGKITENLKNLKEKTEDFKSIVTKSVSKIKTKVVDVFSSISDIFFAILNESIDRIFNFIDTVNIIAEKKGYRLKSLNISFDQPSFEKVSIFGFPIPLPKISLPKTDIGFEKIEISV